MASRWVDAKAAEIDYGDKVRRRVKDRWQTFTVTGRDTTFGGTVVVGTRAHPLRRDWDGLHFDPTDPVQIRRADG